MELTAHVTYELIDRVAHVRLNRPQVRNALSAEIADGLVLAVREAERDRRVRALVLAGDYFHTPVPTALIERVATTGFLAANALLRRWGVAGEPLWSVPTAGRGPVLRAVARRWSAAVR